MSEGPLVLIAPLLAHHLGLEVASIGTQSVLAAVTTRARAKGVTVDDYAVFATTDPAELTALVDEIVVPESWFFRDRVPFSHLAMHAADKLRSGKVRKFRVLSAPCATGEEPYTVVMALLDAGIAPREMEVEAVDVSMPLLALAREGTYRPVSFRGAELAFRDRYFTPAPDGEWQLAAAVRNAVRFRQVNLTAKDLFPDERRYDAILCRNLLIYLTADARRALLSRLGELLVDGGILIVGHAEALEVIDPRWKGIGVAGAFTYQLRGATDKQPVLRPSDKAIPTFVAKRPSERLTAVPTVIRDERATQPTAPLAKPTDRLAEATALADRGQLDQAARVVEEHLVAAGADGKAWALLGSIRQASGDLVRAEECFSRALYCDPGMYNALVSLALLLEKRGEVSGAANLRRRAERAKVKTPGGNA